MRRIAGAVKVDERIEITDEAELKGWLSDRGRQTQIWFAAKCALLAYPAIQNCDVSTKSEVALKALRSLSLSTSAATIDPGRVNELISPLQFSNTVADSAANLTEDDPTRPAFAALDCAATSAITIKLDQPARYALYALADAYEAIKSRRLGALGRSLERYQFSAFFMKSPSVRNGEPLWGEYTQPTKIKKNWDQLKRHWEEDPADWSFWIEWYEAILRGEPLPWELTHRIALEITDEEWNEGQTTVARRINEIRADFVIEQAPQIEEIYETEDGLYEVRSALSDPSNLIDSVLSRVEFALSTAVESNSCLLNDMDLPCKILRHAIKVCPDDPNALESLLRNASDLIVRGMNDGNYGEDDELVFLSRTLDETALQLRADHPDVAEATDQRIKQKLREIDDAKRLLIAQDIENLRDGTGPRLSAELELSADITRVGTSREATAEAIKQSGNRAAKISLAERAKKAESSGSMSAVKIGMRAESLYRWVIELISNSPPV